MPKTYRELTAATLLLFGLFYTNNTIAQHKAKSKWSVQKPFDQYGFIENKGQMVANEQGDIDKNVLYYTNKGNVQLYYNSNSVVFHYDSMTFTKPDKNDVDADAIKDIKVKGIEMTMSWEGANVNPKVEVQSLLSNYYTYPNPSDKTGKTGIVARAWSKLIYHNLYNGIDLEFYYPKDKGGIEYDVIVHPGADISVFKMKYNGASVKLTGNNVLISAPFATFTDHAPSAVNANGVNVSSSFKITDNVVSFNVGSYDKSQLLTIDPWTTSTAFVGNNGAYDLDYDFQGNVYIYGGGNLSNYQLQKYDKTGTLQWTYTSTPFTGTDGGSYYDIGDMTSDRRNGNTYITEGFHSGVGANALKINTLGVQTAMFAGSSNLLEAWCMRFDYCHNQLIIGGGNTTVTYQAGTLDTALTTLNPVNVLGAFDEYHDMSLIAIDDNNAYMASSVSVLGGFNNQLMRLPLPTISPTAYQVYDGHTFREVASMVYYPLRFTGYYSGNEFNGMAVNKNMLITYDGKELKKWRPSNGAYVDSISVSSLYFNWGGLDLDCNGNIYIGNNTNVNIYDSTLTPISTPIAFTSTIYDLRLNGKGLIYTCGNGFVASDTVSLSNMASITFTEPSSCAACDGSATAHICACATPPYTYLWSTGAT
ncbi:MAG TPA: hypothetical protein VNY36_01870, partial [Bacteroidia bacterium]|nr:hypothetical protein [Bacteroidia bacterium]